MFKLAISFLKSYILTDAIMCYVHENLGKMSPTCSCSLHKCIWSGAHIILLCSSTPFFALDPFNCQLSAYFTASWSMCHPLLHSTLDWLVVEARICSSTNGVMLQHVFLKEHSHDVYDQDSLLWWVPLIYVTYDNLDPSAVHDTVMWMKEERHTNIVNLPGPDYFIIVNPDEIGELSMHAAALYIVRCLGISLFQHFFCPEQIKLKPVSTP